MLQVAGEAKKTSEEAAAELGKTTAAKKISETAQFLKQACDVGCCGGLPVAQW